jgi:hypothetical protein
MKGHATSVHGEDEPFVADFGVSFSVERYAALCSLLLWVYRRRSKLLTVDRQHWTSPDFYNSTPGHNDRCRQNLPPGSITLNWVVSGAVMPPQLIGPSRYHRRLGDGTLISARTNGVKKRETSNDVEVGPVARPVSLLRLLHE